VIGEPGTRDRDILLTTLPDRTMVTKACPYDHESNGLTDHERCFVRNRNTLRKNVAVTGIGMICPVGLSTNECWTNFTDGNSGVRRITRFDVARFPTKIAGQLPDEYFGLVADNFPGWSYHSVAPAHLCILTAREALRDARWDDAAYSKHGTAVFTGCNGYLSEDQVLIKDQISELPHKKAFMRDSIPASVSRKFAFDGPSINIAAACAAGGFAVALGVDYVTKTSSPCLAIGVDALLCADGISDFGRLAILSVENEYPQRASRPFEKNRTGFVLSEGACALLLEPAEKALIRGARIYAVVTGVALRSEAHSIVAPEPEGFEMARVMESAIHNAGTPKANIGYVNAHGTSTPNNDLAETRAIKRVFGKNAYNVPVSSQKSMIGHAIGGSGAIQTGVTALSLFHQMLTPTINYDEPDPECDLDYVPNRSRKMTSLEAAIINSFGFGGHNCSIVLEKADV
jgi:3-oxoacyl-[acyl-carrier-protein] synthase II